MEKKARRILSLIFITIMAISSLSAVSKSASIEISGHRSVKEHEIPADTLSLTTNSDIFKEAKGTAIVDNGNYEVTSVEDSTGKHLITDSAANAPLVTHFEINGRSQESVFVRFSVSDFVMEDGSKSVPAGSALVNTPSALYRAKGLDTSSSISTSVHLSSAEGKHTLSWGDASGSEQGPTWQNYTTEWSLDGDLALWLSQADYEKIASDNAAYKVTIQVEYGVV